MTKFQREIHCFDNIDKLADYGIRLWKELADSCIESGENFSAALSGGQTPVPLYHRLAEMKDLYWDKTHVFLADERFVPYDSEDNNYHMVNRVLLRHVRIAPKNIHPVFTSEMSAARAAERYNNDIASYCKSLRVKIPRLHLVILGIGSDGHTASLFKGNPALKEAQKFAVSVTCADTPIQERVTMTLPVLNNAANVVFMASGREKAKAVRDVIENRKSRLPASLVRPGQGRLIFLIDNDAASDLSKSV